MRFFIFSGLVLLLALILQVTWPGFLTVWGIRPDLVMVLVSLNGFLRGPRAGAFYGFAAGLLEDLFAGDFWGVGGLSGLAVGYVTGLAGSKLFKENRFVVTGLVFFTSLLGKTISYILLSMAGLGLVPGVALWKIILPVSLFNAVLTLLVYGRFYRSVKQGLLNRPADA